MLQQILAGAAITLIGTLLVGGYYYFFTEPAPTSKLPSPSPRCRHCGHSKHYTKPHVYSVAMQAQDEPEGCTITEPHIHMKCELCGAAYPVQR